MVLGASLWSAAWALLVHQHWLLWQRTTPAAVERFIADGVHTVLPPLAPITLLKEACAEPAPSLLALAWRSERARLAECIATDAKLAQGELAAQAMAASEQQIHRQISAAEEWLRAHDVQRATLHTRLLDELRAARSADSTRWDQALARFTHRLVALPLSPRQSVGRDEPEEAVARNIARKLLDTREQLKALSVAPGPERLRSLALRAAGLQISTDFGHLPPRHTLVTDRATLADALEWQRKATGYHARGFTLSDLQRLPATLMLTSALCVLVVAVAVRGRLAPIALWAFASWVLGVSALLLTDLALTADPALRYLAERQFIRFSMGQEAIPLFLRWRHDSPIAVWWPLLAAALATAMLARYRDEQHRRLDLVRWWINLSSDARTGWLPLLAAFVSGLAVVLALGMPAAASELLILLAAIGLATYTARQAPLANSGGGLQAYNLVVVALAMACAIGGSLWRGDLGHALVALALAGVFAWLLCGRVLRWLIGATVLAIGGALGACLAADALIGPLAWIAEQLPPHAQDRLHAQFDVYSAAASDMARVRWLIASAGSTGWGPGYVPWQGLAPAGASEGLPLQGPSDYVLAIAVAAWGRWGGLSLLMLILMLFVLGAMRGLQIALLAGVPVPMRWLAALGAYGCWIMALKVLMSVGGVAGVLPLTGVPVALLGYGPVTNFAALTYLALVLGALPHDGAEPVRGVQWRPAAALPGFARRRNQALLVIAAVGLVALVMQADRMLRKDESQATRQHVSRVRLDLAQAVTQALVPIQHASYVSTKGEASCAELAQVVQVWNRRLAVLAHPVTLVNGGERVSGLRLDAARLQALVPAAYQGECKRLARMMGQMLSRDLHQLVGHQEPGGTQRGRDAVALSSHQPPRAVAARSLDYTTGNAWWGVPGCLYLASAGDTACPEHGDWSKAQAMTLMGDPWLQRYLAPTVFAALRHPVGQRELNHRQVAQGPALALTLHPSWQPLAQLVADCYTGNTRGNVCDVVMPNDLDWRRRHFDGTAPLRAGALGLVLVDVATGRIAAMAGAVSDCTLRHLGQTVRPDAQGRLSALGKASRCAQWPDTRSSWLALQHPALWAVPPGSAIKPLALLAGIDRGLVTDGEDDRWTSILAESAQRLPVQRLALASGQRYLDVLSAAGWSVAELDLVWGGPAPEAAAAPMGARWPVAMQSGMRGLKPARMGLDDAERIRAEALSAADANRRYGSAVMSDYVAARRLADAALGGADIRVSALGLAHWWRAVDLRAAGQSRAPHLHLLERSGQAVPDQPLDWLTPGAAQRVLAMTRGVSSSAWKGTAQGSCRVVFGSCPADGLAHVSGKTGTSDFLLAEDSAWVKPGQQVPAKLFGGVFTGRDGRRYAIAVTALRVRQPGTETLELSSSAPAEAAFTLMREIGLRSSTMR